MAMYSLNMLRIAIELAQEGDAYLAEAGFDFGGEKRPQVAVSRKKAKKVPIASPTQRHMWGVKLPNPLKIWRPRADSNSRPTV
jgi:hypothetical protein